MQHPISRRQALALSTTALLAQAGPARSAAKSPVIGLIGCGGMGRHNMARLMEKGVPVAAVCDVDSAHAAQAAAEVEKAQNRKPEVLEDFRKLLERRDIDAVIIATPDHWHALPSIAACQAGKDVYLEKPISHNIVEGRRMVAAARHHQRVVQVGTWQRSTANFVNAVHHIRAGRLGRITTVRAWKTDEAHVGKNLPEAPPRTLNYDFWVGPARMVPYTAKNCHYNWRWYWNTAAGMTGDWGVHMMDIGVLAMSPGQEIVMPERISSYGGNLAFPEDDRTTPDTQVAIYRFPHYVLHWETGRKPVDGVEKARNNATQFISADGRSLTVWRGGTSLLDPDGKALPPMEERFDGVDHWQDWLNCIESRSTPRSDIGSMHSTTALCHLANVAYLEGESIEWDAAAGDLKGKRGRHQLPYEREYRAPWKLPKTG